MKLGYHPLAIRYALLSAHYRQPLNFTFESLKAATQAVQRLNDFYMDLQFIFEEQLPESDHLSEIFTLTEELSKKFQEALDDDLHIPNALSHIFNFINYFNSRFGEGYLRRAKIGAPDVEHVIRVFDGINQVLAVILGAPPLDPEVESLLLERKEKRRQKNWKDSDAIRTLLRDAYAISVEDRPTGQKWKYLFSRNIKNY